MAIKRLCYWFIRSEDACMYFPDVLMRLASNRSSVYRPFQNIVSSFHCDPSLELLRPKAIATPTFMP